MVNIVASRTFGMYLMQDRMRLKRWKFQTLGMDPTTDALKLSPTLACMLGIFTPCSALEFVRMQTVERVTLPAVPLPTRAVYRVQSKRVGDGRGDGRRIDPAPLLTT